MYEKHIRFAVDTHMHISSCTCLPKDMNKCQQMWEDGVWNGLVGSRAL